MWIENSMEEGLKCYRNLTMEDYKALLIILAQGTCLDRNANLNEDKVNSPNLIYI